MQNFYKRSLIKIKITNKMYKQRLHMQFFIFKFVFFEHTQA